MTRALVLALLVLSSCASPRQHALDLCARNMHEDIYTGAYYYDWPECEELDFGYDRELVKRALQR